MTILIHAVAIILLVFVFIPALGVVFVAGYLGFLSALEGKPFWSVWNELDDALRSESDRRRRARENR